MAKNSPNLTNFNSAELSPDLAARVDLDKYVRGASVMSRFLPRIQGGARRCPGTRYVTQAKASSNTLLRKFIFSQGQAYVIEFGVGYCRFYQNHAQVAITTPGAWNNSTNYAQGSLVNLGGVNYYAWNTHGLLNGQNLNQNPAIINSPYWYALSGLIYEVPTPWTPFAADGTPGIQIEQSADVVYVAASAGSPVLPITLTRNGPTNWVVQFYWPPDGPFLTENSAPSPAVYAVPIAGSPATYDIFSTAPLFSANDAGGINNNGVRGRLLRIDAQWFNIAPWTSGNGITAGFYRRNDGNTYLALNSQTTGSVPPTHTFGVAFDGSAGVQWLYVDSGYGIVEINNFISSTHVQGTATLYAGGGTSTTGKQQYLMPIFVQGTTAAITSISKASQAVVGFSGGIPSGLIVGDPLYLTNVGGMTQISEQMFTVVQISGNNVTINVDSTGFSAYTSGGTGIRNASLNWSLGAWGYPTAQTPGGFPTCGRLWGDRLFWAGGVNGISWWGSAPGSYNSHAQDIYGQVTAACGIDGIIASDQVDAITWLAPAFLLLIGTKGGEFALSQLTTTEPLGPGNTDIQKQSKFRSRSIQPEYIGTTNYYVQLSGKKVLAQDYNFYLNRYDSTNQNRLANHIMGYTIAQGCIDIAYHAEPYETLWAVRSDGVLVGYTLDRQDDVTGWTEQPMAPSAAGAAKVLSACVIPAPDGTRDEAWLAVQRTINGATVCSIEYIEKDYESGDAQSAQCYLDMSAQFTGVTGTVVSGLTWLNNETVGILMDGGYQGTAVVTGSVITLPSPANNSTIQVGLPYVSTITTMDIEGGADVGTAQGKMKRPSSVVARLKNSLGAQVRVEPAASVVSVPAPQFTDLITYDPTNLILGAAPPLFTGDSDPIPLPADSARNCKLTIRNSTPYQTELQGLFPSITVQEPSPP